MHRSQLHCKLINYWAKTTTFYLDQWATGQGVNSLNFVYNHWVTAVDAVHTVPIYFIHKGSWEKYWIGNVL